MDQYNNQGIFFDLDVEDDEDLKCSLSVADVIFFFFMLFVIPLLILFFRGFFYFLKMPLLVLIPIS